MSHRVLSAVALLLVGAATGCVRDQPAEMAGFRRISADECTAFESSASNKALAEAQSFYQNRDYQAARHLARDSYEACWSPLAAFYYGAALYYVAEASVRESPINADFAKARCLLEEALDDQGSRRLSDSTTVNEARDIVNKTIDRGAVHLKVKAVQGLIEETAVQGTAAVTSGNRRYNEVVHMSPEGESFCVMPGPHQIYVIGESVGRGKATVHMKSRKDTDIQFEQSNPRSIPNSIATFATLGTIVSIGAGWGVIFSQEGRELTPGAEKTMSSIAAAGGILIGLSLVASLVADQLPKSKLVPVIPRYRTTIGPLPRRGQFESRP